LSLSENDKRGVFHNVPAFEPDMLSHAPGLFAKNAVDRYGIAGGEELAEPIHHKVFAVAPPGLNQFRRGLPNLGLYLGSKDDPEGI
jgi:hypothetical protein